MLPSLLLAICLGAFTASADRPIDPALLDPPADWRLFTCAIENPSARIVAPTWTWLAQNSPRACIDMCISQGFEIAGLEFGAGCFCSNALAPGVSAGQTNMGACNIACSGTCEAECEPRPKTHVILCLGSTSQRPITCGGSNRVAIYMTLSKTDQYKYCLRRRKRIETDPSVINC